MNLFFFLLINFTFNINLLKNSRKKTVFSLSLINLFSNCQICVTFFKIDAIIGQKNVYN